MNNIEEARQAIHEAEEDTFQRKHSSQWAQTYLQAMEVMKESGFPEEADHAGWMGYLMSLDFTHAKTEPERSWLVVPNEIADEGSQGINNEMLDYYAMQAQTLTNPIIKVRCCEIIWSIRKKQHSFARCAIDAHLAASRIYHDRKVLALSQVHLSRAIDLAKPLKDQDRLLVAKNEWNHQLKTVYNLTESGAFLHLVDIIRSLDNVVEDDERKKIAEQCEAVAGRFIQIDWLNERKWLEKAYGLYHKTGDSEAARRCLIAMAQSAHRQAEAHISGGGFIYAINPLEEARMHYVKLGPDYAKQADKMSIMLSEAHSKAPGQMGCIKAPLCIPIETIESYTNKLKQKTLHDALESLFHDRGFIPQITNIEKQVAEMSNTFPLLNRISSVLLDGRNTVARADPNDPKEYRIFAHMGRWWQELSQWLALLVGVVINTHNATPTDFDFLLYRPLAESTRKSLINRGLERYISGDSVSALHILIPQFEACIRDLLKSLGRPTSQPSKQPGLSEEILLDKMLRDKKLRLAIGDDLYYFYRFVFSDQRGWNLRNRICHGLVDESELQFLQTSVVIYAFVSLSWVDITVGEDIKSQ